MSDPREAPSSASQPATEATGGPSMPDWSAPSGTPIPPAPSAIPPVSSSSQRAGSGSLLQTARDVVADLDDKISAAQMPFDSVRSGIEWWYRPFAEARTWVALGSLFLGVVWAPIAFTLVALVVVPTAALCLVGLGFLLVVPAFGFVNGIAAAERGRAAWIGEPIEAPTFMTSSGGPVSAIGVRLRDGARWRQVLFFAIFLVLGPVLFVLGFAPWGILFGQVVGSDFDTDVFDLGGFIFALLFAGAAPRITVLVARVGRAVTAALLGPTETAELQERVTKLSGQRQQILDAVSDERRRIERNLHDGVQQQLVALGIDIGRANARLESDPQGARELLDEAREKVRGSIGELRLIGRGLHPAVLEDRGLDAALSAVVASAPIPIAVDITTTAALPEDVASTAYYVASEAVANILKHAQARVASIRLDDAVSEFGPAVRLTVHDDGRGGADISRGSGLAGMRARSEGADGTFSVSSPAGGPTTLVVMLPLTSRSRSNGDGE